MRCGLNFDEQLRRNVPDVYYFALEDQHFRELAHLHGKGCPSRPEVKFGRLEARRIASHSRLANCTFSPTAVEPREPPVCSRGPSWYIFRLTVRRLFPVTRLVHEAATMPTSSELVETWIPDGGFKLERRKVRTPDGGGTFTECLVPKWEFGELVPDQPCTRQPCLHRIVADCPPERTSDETHSRSRVAGFIGGQHRRFSFFDAVPRRADDLHIRPPIRASPVWITIASPAFIAPVLKVHKEPLIPENYSSASPAPSLSSGRGGAIL